MMKPIFAILVTLFITANSFANTIVFDGLASEKTFEFSELISSEFLINISDNGLELCGLWHFKNNRKFKFYEILSRSDKKLFLGSNEVGYIISGSYLGNLYIGFNESNSPYSGETSFDLEWDVQNSSFSSQYNNTILGGNFIQGKIQLAKSKDLTEACGNHF